MHDSQKLNRRALLIQTHCNLEDDYESSAAEFKSLVQAADINPTENLSSTRTVPDAKYYVGRGKALEIQAIVQEKSLDLVLFNHTLSASQNRNLEKLFNCTVIDRNELVLNIFAQRARSFEGKLQVLLAQLQHLSTRLIRGWTHLERQKGGIGLRGGPGETQLEIDRRLLRHRIKALKAKLEKVKQQRSQNRRSRQHSSTPLIALVGYTNAGKSTLFNHLTNANTKVADQLFATLDPLIRRFSLPNHQKVLLADTVGFIRQLPHEFIDAFSATLEEVKKADLLLHVVDASHPNRLKYIEAVNIVLTQIGAHNIPQLMVYNKIDLMPIERVQVENVIDNKDYIGISSKTGEGFSQLYSQLIEHLSNTVEAIEE